MNRNEPTIEDDEFDFKPGLKIGDIALEQYRRCIIEGSKEMVRGGLQKKLVNGKIIEFEIANQRQIFINCVQSFKNLIKPFLEDKNSDEFDRLQNKLKKIVKHYFDEEKKIREDTSYNDPKTKTKVIDRKLYDYKLSEINNDHELDTVEVYREILELFSLVLNELDYFSETGVSA